MNNWRVVFTRKAASDAKKLTSMGFRPRAEVLLQILTDGPLRSFPPFNKLTGDLTGAYSRRIDIQHRLVYQVLAPERVVKVLGCVPFANDPATEVRPYPEVRDPSAPNGGGMTRAVRLIAVEGVIGVGKTSLVHRLHAECGGRRFLERFEENPFLVGGFYQDMTSHAFDTELFFLLARFRQQREVAGALAETDGPVFSDYVFEKNRIFAELTLGPDDFAIWQRLFETLAPEATRPDLVIYLRSTTDALIERIRTRNRPFERDIEVGYIDRLNAAYERFFESHDGPLLVIDVSRLDFIASDADWNAVRALVDHRIAAIEAGQRELDLTRARR